MSNTPWGFDFFPSDSTLWALFIVFLLALWKVCDIAVWIFQHVHLSFQ